MLLPYLDATTQHIDMDTSVRFIHIFIVLPALISLTMNIILTVSLRKLLQVKCLILVLVSGVELMTKLEDVEDVEV